MKRLVSMMLLGLLLSACGGATRALLHENDMAKVFPWPRGEEQVQVRVKAETTMANMCFFFGSFETVTVDKDTTFYMEDERGRKFAYTPSLSPIRRLSRLKQAEIRWPNEIGDEEGEEEEGEEGEEGVGEGGKPDPGKPDPGKPDPGKPDPGKNAAPEKSDAKASAD